MTNPTSISPTPRTSDYNQPDTCQIDVSFETDLSMEDVVTRISHLSQPQVILWYIGCNGLRSSGIQFYKDSLISPILTSKLEARLWLVDLTAWGAFRNPRCSIRNTSHACEIIEKFPNKKIKCVPTSKIFTKMQEIDDEDLLSHFKKALSQSFISEPSDCFAQRNIQIKDVFSGRCSIVSDWYDADTGKSYSILQYLEGCLLVDEVFMEQIRCNASEIQIVFALPNDEIKYYKNSDGSFQKDVEFLILKRCRELNIPKIRLQVRFLSFKYGSTLQDRPYNAPGKVIKKGHLSYEDMFGNMKI